MQIKTEALLIIPNSKMAAAPSTREKFHSAVVRISLNLRKQSLPRRRKSRRLCFCISKYRLTHRSIKRCMISQMYLSSSWVIWSMSIKMIIRLRIIRFQSWSIARSFYQLERKIQCYPKRMKLLAVKQNQSSIKTSRSKFTFIRLPRSKKCLKIHIVIVRLKCQPRTLALKTI